MRVLLDEDVSVPLLQPLRHLCFGRHDIDHATQVHLAGRPDIPLLRLARDRGYQAVVTNDLSQLADPEETRAIAKSGLHHIRFAQRPGRNGLAFALGALIASLPSLLDELEHEEGQRIVRVEGLNPARRRYTIVDPWINRPAYWPRRKPRR
jgi:hypothetical protein